MKVIITGRRAPNQTWVEMKLHMLKVHGPLVASEMGGSIASYIQNQVRDGRYGAGAPVGRDMVAEVSFNDGGPMPEKKQVVIDDEPMFAHQSDLFPMLTTEEIVMQPPAAAGPTEAPRNFKVLCYLAPSEEMTTEAFMSAWGGLDRAVYAIDGLCGYVKSVALPESPPASPYKGVAGLWFHTGIEEKGLADWHRLISAARLVDADRYFCLYVDEHRII